MAKKHSASRGLGTAGIVVLLAAIMTGFRIGCSSLLVDGNTQAFRIHVALLALLVTLLLVLVCVAILLKPRRPHKKVSVWPVAISAGLLGVIMAIFTIYDIVMWAKFGQTPAPSKTLISPIDAVVLGGYLLTGLASAAYFIRLMLLWIAEGTCYRGIFKVGALMPAMWMWLRVVRYELTHVSLFDMAFSIHDFAMLAFSMLFLFRIAALTSGINGRKHSVTMFITAAAAMCALSSVAVRFGLYLTGDAVLYQTVQLANGLDACIGLYALSWVHYLWNDGASSSTNGKRDLLRFLAESDNTPYQPDDFFEEPESPLQTDSEKPATADQLFMDIISTGNDPRNDT